MTKNIKIIRTATVALSLDLLLNGQLKYLNQYYNIIGVSGADHHLKNVETREHVNTISVEMERKISPLKDIVSLFRLIKLFYREQPTIVHSITPKAGLLSMLAAKITGVPLRIHTFTGLLFPYKSGFLQKLLITMDKILCYCATNIYPESEGVKNDLIKYNITSKPLKILGKGNINGVNIEYFNKENQYTNPFTTSSSETFHFIFIGRIVKDKGIVELCEAFKALQKQISNIKLALIGPFEDDLDPLPKDILNEINSNADIITTGFQNDIRPYLKFADCFVFPSHREGFPNVILQAGAMQVPCIVTDISGSNEIIENNINGLIAKVNNTKELEYKMLEMYNNHEFRLKSAQLLHRKVVKYYNQEYIWQCIKDEYEKLLKQL